jgi:hypothetical protein
LPWCRQDGAGLTWIVKKHNSRELRPTPAQQEEFDSFETAASRETSDENVLYFIRERRETIEKQASVAWWVIHS